ncbi:MAG TPA: serine/threonine-protein kinase, partial [Burkholderiales bacterium]|nr:serine/threonine-protein kinase [Burkholderiales bacterium]
MDLSLQVGKYDIQRALGKGATGTVYLAKDTFTGKEVALKTIEPEVFRDPEFGTVYRSQFLQEASLAGKLRHPYIVEIYEAGVAEDFGYIVMEYVAGGTLRQHTRAGKLLAVEAVIEIVYKVCNALDYANRIGLLHRDIKPANVMLTADNVVKVMDFGTAYFTDSDETQVFD